jgi:hypothetical protein
MFQSPLLPIDDLEHLRTLRRILGEAGLFDEEAWPAVVHR